MPFIKYLHLFRKYTFQLWDVLKWLRINTLPILSWGFLRWFLDFFQFFNLFFLAFGKLGKRLSFRFTTWILRLELFWSFALKLLFFILLFSTLIKDFLCYSVSIQCKSFLMLFFIRTKYLCFTAFASISRDVYFLVYIVFLFLKPSWIL